eukprot:TRINITY_DN15713_c0_g1_i1.p1 TRINITY_DN15713_c0_g1~~TRINITY_DN15713_c0_g1_i1.p1  ORF type:complete len:460 (+),score=33.20 TRINITY_DN15713_c0_g1_i1:88-1380(+)
MYGAVLKLREAPPGRAKFSPPITPSIMATLRNKPFMRILPAWVLDVTTTAMVTTMLPFYVEYVVAPRSAAECDRKCCAVLGKCYSDAMCSTEFWMAMGWVSLMTAYILSKPLWLAAAKVLGKRKAWLGFNLLTAVTHCLFVFATEGDTARAVVLAFVNGLPMGGDFLTQSIVADITDYDEFRTGLRNEGRFTIFQIFIPKLVGIPSQILPLALLSAWGFVSPCPNGDPYHPQPRHTKRFIQVVFFVIPTICSFASYLIKRGFPITEAMGELIREGCTKHAQNLPAYDPLRGTVHILPWYLTEPGILESAVWKLDVFTLKQLELFQADAERCSFAGRVSVEQSILWRFRRLLGLGVVLLLTTLVSLSLGWIAHPTTSWVPSCSVVFCVMSFVAAAFHHSRLVTARELLEAPDTWDTVTSQPPMEATPWNPP